MANKAVKSERDRQEKAQATAARIAAALAPFEAVETPLRSVYAYSWLDQVSVILTPERGDEAGALLREVLHLLRQRKADKKFDQYSGKVKYVIAAPNLDVTIDSVPPRCEVEEYTETEVTPAHTETRTKFRLKNPEECLGTGAAKAAGDAV